MTCTEYVSINKGETMIILWIGLYFVIGIIIAIVISFCHYLRNWTIDLEEWTFAFIVSWPVVLMVLLLWGLMSFIINLPSWILGRRK